MERFKKALKAALTQQSAKIAIEEAAELSVISPDGAASKLLDLPPADGAWIDSLYAFLFKDDLAQIDSGSPVQGSLNVPGVGLLKAIGHKKPNGRHLSLYFPAAGEAFFNKDWENASAPAPSEPASVVETAPPAESALPSNMFTPEAQDLSELPEEDTSGSDMFAVAGEDAQSSSDMFSMPAEPAAEAPAADTEDAAEDFSPSDMFSMPAEPAESEQPTENEQSSDMFQAGGMTESIENSQPDSVSFEAPAPSEQPAPAQQVTNNQGTPVEATTVKKIVFGNDDPSTTIFRNGDFPIDAYLRKMMEIGASDMHLTLGQPLIYRIDGDLQRVGTDPIDEHQMENLMLPIMPQANKTEFADCYDTDFAYEIPGVGRFRVNMFKDNYGVGAVLRQIPAEVLTADQLGLPPAIRKFCTLHKGLVLVTGPTGSGKSTTLAAMIDLINKTRPEHILTIEDPIEFVHSQQKCLVNQREVGKHTGSFKRALKAALREDPDIVLIGELRDLETIHIALETAETGHLVFGTLHTNTAVSTIDRIIDQFPADQQSQIRTMVAASLKGVVAQTLIKKKGGGRCAAQEILVPNDAVANMIRESKNHMIENHMQTQKNDGNMLLNDHLLLLIKEGKIEAKEAYYKSIDKASFIDNAKRAGVDISFMNDIQQAS